MPICVPTETIELEIVTRSGGPFDVSKDAMIIVPALKELLRARKELAKRRELDAYTQMATGPEGTAYVIRHHADGFDLHVDGDAKAFLVNRPDANRELREACQKQSDYRAKEVGILPVALTWRTAWK